MLKVFHFPQFIVGALCVVILLGVFDVYANGASSQHPVSIAKVQIGSDGRIHIFDSRSEEFIPPAEEEQVGVDQPKISENKQVAGWLVNFKNCCTSYPIPLTLVIYQPGKPLEKFGDGLMIGGWFFVDGGRHIVFSSNTVHPNGPSNYELHDVSGGRLLHKWSGEPGKHSPKWTRVFEQP
ncbi:MAG TPA: hypothetical protein VN684_09995 [Terriglobales bacterium]|nr:hypothetical protein [Terriglobales bacterium]